MPDDILLLAASGLAAGLGVAMPLGAVAALLLREGLVNGFRVAASGAAGVALVDTAYCALATTSSALAAPLIEARRGVFLVASGLLVIGIGVRQLVTSLRRRTAPTPPVAPTSPLAAFGRFVGLTAVNPLTLVYFVALSGALTTDTASWAGPLVFVGAAGLASLVWQLVLAAAGSLLRRSLGARTVEVIGILASVLVIGLGSALFIGGVSPP